MPAYDHVFVVVMENTSYSTIVGSSAAPYINSLLQAGGLATNYYGVTHPSLPNYLALVGGSTFGITSDCTTCWISAPNIADNLELSGSTWKAYMESMPSACFVGDSYPYAQKHNPFIYFNDIRNDAARCQSHVVPYSQLGADLASTATTPNFAFITPNMCNDMHDCSVSTGDSWLQAQVPQILGSAAFKTQRSLLMLTWDEDDFSTSNRVAAILVGSGITPGVTSGVTYNHYSLLRTIEQARGLPALTSNDAGAAAMGDLFANVAPPVKTPCTSVSVTTSPAPPAMAGSQVVITAGASGCPNPVFQFWMRPAGWTAWWMVQGYSSNGTYRWNSTGAAPGTLYFGVWARDASSIDLYDSFTSMPFAVTDPSCGSVTVSASPASPLPHGTGAHVTFTATASGCSNPNPLYEFWFFNGSTWQLVQGWSTSATYDWNTTGGPAGTWSFGVWARDVASSGLWSSKLGSYDTYAGISYRLA